MTNTRQISSVHRCNSGRDWSRRLRLTRLLVVALLLVAIVRTATWEGPEISAECAERGDVFLSGSVEGAKPGRAGQHLLEVLVLEVGTPVCGLLVGERVRLYVTAEHVQATATISGHARLRPPWGSSNPGAFDYRRWLLGQGFAASGYMRDAEVVQPVKPSSIVDFRGYVHGGLLKALTLGDRDGVSAELWALFRGTGTIHLMVISGLHVGIFSGLVYFLCFGLLRILPVPVKSTRPSSLALLVALFCTVGFALFSGAQPPVMRAACMTGVAMLLLISLRANASWLRGLLLIAAVTLIAAPRFMLLQGFWLSYLAVAALLFHFGHMRRRQSFMRALCACQGVLFIVLTPWIGFLTGFVPAVGVLANLLVVPFMSLWVIPLAMLGVATCWFAPLSQVLLSVADVSLALVLEVLQRLYLQPTPGLGPVNIGRLCLAVPASLLLLAPLPARVRLLSTFGWLPLLLPSFSGVTAGEFAVTVLDVGQGSAALVDTHTSRTLVDAGVSYPDGFDAGEAIVLPALRATGANRLDHIILSHLDQDHAGGMPTVTRNFPGPAVIGLNEPCRNNHYWRADGVEFRLIQAPGALNRNDRSCTLLVTNGRRSAYLSGDISSRVERQLLAQLPRRVDLLVAPHHGSAGSSSPAFVAWLAPRFTVFSAARFNRYQHPRPATVAKYQRRGSTVATTGLDGAVRWYSGQPARLHTARGNPL